MTELEKPKDFAIIHNTLKGQLLVTMEPDEDKSIITLWVKLEKEIGIAKLELKIATEEAANEIFEGLKDCQVAKGMLNKALNQKYL